MKQSTGLGASFLVGPIFALAICSVFSSGNAQVTQAAGPLPVLFTHVPGAFREWGTDNFFYQWTGATWARTVLYRVFPDPANPNIWDAYSSVDPQRTWIMRVDESHPGWVYVYLAGNEPMAWPITNPKDVLHMGSDNSVIFVLEPESRQWVSFAQVLSAAQALKPREVAPNVREVIPDDDSKRTPEERAWIRNMNAAIVSGTFGPSQAHICDMKDRSYDTHLGRRQRECRP